MLRGLFLVSVFLTFFGIAISAEAPFILTLGFVWVDMIRPTDIVYGVLKGIPFSMMIGAGALLTYLLMDRRDPPRVSALLFLVPAFVVWVTLTTLWAVLPDPAWAKWDWASKTVLFAVFIPYVIRSRNQIEAFIQVFVFSLAANMIPYGAKTLVSGGIYGHNYGLMNGNKFLAEGATMATASLLAIPLILYLMKHGRIFPRYLLGLRTVLGYIGLIALALLTAIGTHERTALVGMVVLVVSVWIRSRRKIAFGAVCAVIGGLIAFAAPASWTDRMSTISANPQDNSAAGRLEVWKWTYKYVLAHPLGGGFDMYHIDTIVIPGPPGPDGEPGVPAVQVGRAFHSSYFEVLGEHGWVGLALFLGIIYLSFRYLRQAARGARGNPSLLWVSDLSSALRSSLLTLLFCELFIGIAFQPFLYYLCGLAMSLREYVRRVQSESQVPIPARLAVPSLA